MGKKILFLSNHFITLFNFRRELIVRLVEEKHEVYISIPSHEENRYFADLGCNIIETPIDRRGINPIKDIGLLLRYIRIMIGLNPDIIFSYTIKPNIFGCIASNLTGNRQISNVTGTGATFLKDSLISKIVKLLYKVSIKKSHKVYFQNGGDRDYFVQNKLVRENHALLPGSGVNLEKYALTEFPPDDQFNFIYIGRIMEVKGVSQYLECAREIKRRHPKTNFYIAGFIEEDHYKDTIYEHHSNGIIKYIGFQKNIILWIKKCHCTILPSYGGEGVPNVLLESAAIGRICIASRIDGSKDVVDDGVTGYLFEPRNTTDLIEKVERLLDLDYQDMKQMGYAGRKKIEKEFDREFVINAYLSELDHIREDLVYED